ncbi:zinc transporter 1 [Amborella trichopoda]|uniref:Zinc transporter n=1 Tax=Amborella trichopoda TaxID=13333 RepID=W1PJW0_AMBTC|nr:zinc transporter 1 [Amborella trichopoda]ERN07951.1 hypothetical protein AMTR_s00012p00248530 [Amborella trichopoda]|eukprot:XP_006846276.1 zinc transporter 1 [Amborella trichopoda]
MASSKLKLSIQTPILIPTLFLFLSLQTHHTEADGGHDAAGDSSSSSSLHSEGLITVKIWCLIIMLMSTFLGGVSPYFYRWNESFLLLGTQFAGGVFLGTSLMHFLSDSQSQFGDLTSKSYPFSFMLASAGYLLTMLGDCVVLWFTGGNRGEVKDEEVGSVESERGAQFVSAFVKTTYVGDTVLLILALCFHSVFEGIAVGIADTKADAWRNLWVISLHKIFAAISMGIALLRMLPNRPLLTTVAYSFSFAISSPIGVGIGITINTTTEGRAADWIYAISMGLACGVFIYVAINHLIAKGFKPTNPSYFDTSYWKFLAVLIGVLLIAIVMIWDS